MATITLAGVYVVFRSLTSPFLDVDHVTHVPGSQSAVAPVSTEYLDQARRWLPTQPWVAEATKYFHDRGRYLYCQDFGLLPGDHSFEVRPLAMIWHSRPDDTPVTLVADSAQLDSTRPISMNSTELGQIASGFISGSVRIDGPDGLKIEGCTFHLSSDSMKLWSNDPVRFAWETHSGSAAGGVEIFLNGMPGTRDGLTSVTDIRRVRLNGKVVCHFLMPAERAGQDDMKLDVQAAGGFSFDVLTKTGTFAGLLPRAGETKLKDPRNEVWVRRINADQSIDQLVCPELEFQFRNGDDATADDDTGGRMKLEHVVAWGRQVVFHSKANGVLLQANEIRYAMDQRRLDIRHNNLEGSAEKKFVQLTQADNVLRVPHIRILHAADGSVQRVECNGEGQISGTMPESPEGSDEDHGTPDGKFNNEPPMKFAASWLKSLVMQVAPDLKTRLITMEGQASVSESTRDFRLSAQKIGLKLVPPVGGPSRSTMESADGAQPPVGLADLQPEILKAEGNVVVDSPFGGGVLRNDLTVRFETMLAAGPIRQASLTRTETEGSSKDEKQGSAWEPPPGEKISFTSDSLDAVVGITSDPKNRQAEFRNMWLKGGVELVRQAADSSGSFRATGNQLYAAGTDPSAMEVKLFGDPAVVTRDTGKVEGPRLDLIQQTSEVQVQGSGRMSFLTEKGFDGSVLPEPMPLDIYWSDHMYFQGRSASFVGNIRIVMRDAATQNVELQCSGLTVHFSQDVRLGPSGADNEFKPIPDSSGETGAIERIECHNRVTVSIDQFADGEQTGRHRATFADLKLNLQNGDFTAFGPGDLDSVTPDEGGQLQGPVPATARANTPSQTTETAFVCMKTTFIGELKGNIHRRDATLTQNVVAVVAPARRVDERISLQEMPTDQLPERAGILQAELLTISSVPGHSVTDESKSTPISAGFAVVARGNSRLESRSLSASADVITYDHQKQQFIIRAEGDGTVIVNHRSGTGARFDQLKGKRFEYYRRTNQLNAAGLGGLNLSE
ncbi:MAG: hypothetical protein R3C49_18625 [Planctomycetaceae bacterium]